MILRLSDMFVLDLSPLVLALSDDRVSNCQENTCTNLIVSLIYFFKINAFFHSIFFQTSILASLSEIKKKNVMLNDRIQLLNEILGGIDVS